jgi:hypothetical protein
MSAAARTALSDYTIDATVGRFADLYDSLLAGQAGATSAASNGSSHLATNGSNHLNRSGDR